MTTHLTNFASGHPNINFVSPCAIAFIVRHFFPATLLDYGLDLSDALTRVGLTSEFLLGQWSNLAAGPYYPPFPYGKLCMHNTRTHACPHGCDPAPSSACACLCERVREPTLAHTGTCAPSLARTRARMCVRIHYRSHTSARTSRHYHTQIHAHAHPHTRALA